MKKVLIIATLMYFQIPAFADSGIAVVDYSVIMTQSKVGQSVSQKISFILKGLQKKFADLEDKLKLAESKKTRSSKSGGVVFDKKIDFDATAYLNSSEKDKHLMLYTLAQRKSNEVSDLAAEAERNLRVFLKKCITAVAKNKKLKVVLDKSAVVFSDACSVKDITGDVIKEADANIKCFVYPKGLEKIK